MSSLALGKEIGSTELQNPLTCISASYQQVATIASFYILGVVIEKKSQDVDTSCNSQLVQYPLCFSVSYDISLTNW